MSVPKITGIETEYGILICGARESDPFFASRLLLQHYNPACLPTEAAEPAMHQSAARCGNAVPHQPWLGGGPVAASAIGNGDIAARDDALGGGATADTATASPWDFMLPNGARFYIDHAHPEFSTAEAATPRGVVAADKAGERIVEACRQRANASGLLPQGTAIAIYKNNSDQKGNSYGCHENYLLATPTFESLVNRQLHRTLATLVPFLATRTILCGAGKVGSENGAQPAGFQLSQRADFFEAILGLQTTYHRPLVNTRDEPHADPSRFRRLHVIAGDANMAEYSTFLKVGTTQLVLLMIEDGRIPFDLTLASPLDAVRTVSRDLSFCQKVPLAHGKAMSALEIQTQFLEAAKGYVGELEDKDAYLEVVRIWEETLQALREDWRALGSKLDWAIKRNLMERYLQNQGTDWETVRRWQWPIEMAMHLGIEPCAADWTPTLETMAGTDRENAELLAQYAKEQRLSWNDYAKQRETYFSLRKLDLEYHDIRHGSAGAGCGLFYRLQAKGAVDRLLTDEEIDRLLTAPPEDTRAYLRGYCIRRYGDQLCEADWERLTFYLPETRQQSSLILPDPGAGGREQLEPLLADDPALPVLLERLNRSQYGFATGNDAI